MDQFKQFIVRHFEKALIIIILVAAFIGTCLIEEKSIVLYFYYLPVLSAGYFEAYYLRAVRVRNLIRREFRELFRRIDVLLLPTTPTAAWPLGTKRHHPLAMYLSDIFTVTANLAGLPAVSIPVGHTQAGLPVGLQLWGEAHSDAALLSAAATLEAELGYDPHRT